MILLEVWGCWGRGAAEVSRTCFPSFPPWPVAASSWCQPCSHGNHLPVATYSEMQQWITATWLGLLLLWNLYPVLFRGHSLTDKTFYFNNSLIRLSFICPPALFSLSPSHPPTPLLPLCAAEFGQCQIMFYSQPEKEIMQGVKPGQQMTHPTSAIWCFKFTRTPLPPRENSCIDWEVLYHRSRALALIRKQSDSAWNFAESSVEDQCSTANQQLSSF